MNNAKVYFGLPVMLAIAFIVSQIFGMDINDKVLALSFGGLLFLLDYLSIFVISKKAVGTADKPVPTARDRRLLLALIILKYPILAIAVFLSMTVWQFDPVYMVGGMVVSLAGIIACSYSLDRRRSWSKFRKERHSYM